MKTLLLKLDDDIYNSWKASATEAQLKVSEWIRRQCNREVRNGNGNTNDQNLSRAASREVPRRRTTAAGHQPGRRDSDLVGASGTAGVPARATAVTERNQETVRDDQTGRENVPQPVVHTATSHRYTCLCPTCVGWRKCNGIPVGGPIKKEKK